MAPFYTSYPCILRSNIQSHGADDALRHRSVERRVDPPESQRHRHQREGNSHSRRQPAHQPTLCAARYIGRLLFTEPDPNR